MPRESTIRIFRSDTAASVPSLTAGEIAVNIPDQRLFVGNSTGGVIPFYGNGVSGINGITGGVSITNGSSITITQSGKTITIASSANNYTAPLATSSVTGVASFRAADFDVSMTGSVSLTSVARTNVSNTFPSPQYIGESPNRCLLKRDEIEFTDNGAGTQIWTPTYNNTNIRFPSFSTVLAGLSGSQTFAGLQTFSMGISANGITGTILTPSQTNITAVGTLTSLTTSGLLSTQALNVVAGATFGIDIYAPNMVTGVNGITGAVSITNGSNITITQTGKQITIASTASGGGITWSVVTADQSFTVNTGVFANKSSGTLTLTLPTTAAVGTSIRVSGMQNTWRVAQNASQKINFGSISTTTGTGGYLESTNARDSVELVCCVANTEWNVVSSIGNMTIV